MKPIFFLTAIFALLSFQSVAIAKTTKEKCGVPNYKEGPKWFEDALCIVKEHCPKCGNLTKDAITPGNDTFVDEHDNVVDFHVKFKKPVQIDGIDCPNEMKVKIEPTNPGLITYFAPVKTGFVFKIDGLNFVSGAIQYNENGERLKVKVRQELDKFLGKTKFTVTETFAHRGSKFADVETVRIHEAIKRCGLTIPAESRLYYMGSTVNELIVKPSKTMTVNGITIRPTHHFVIAQGEVCDPYAVDEEEAKKVGND